MDPAWVSTSFVLNGRLNTGYILVCIGLNAGDRHWEWRLVSSDGLLEGSREYLRVTFYEDDHVIIGALPQVAIGLALLKGISLHCLI